MQFSKFLIELENPTETPEPNDSPILQSDINNRLAQELQDIIISPSFAYPELFSDQCTFEPKIVHLAKDNSKYHV